MHAHLPAALALATLHTAVPAQGDGTESGFSWPDGELAAALRGIGADVEPEPAPAALWPEREDDPAWVDDAPWLRWSELLVRRAGGTLAEAELAELALVTLAQGRDQDGWRHLAALAERSPERAAGILPRFFPGVPPEFAAVTGGLPPPLPDGVVLRPALPPPLGPLDPDVLLEARGVTLRGLAIGSAVCDLLCDLRTDGMDLRFEHRSGGEATAAAVLPCPPGFARWSEYADWDRQEELGGAHPVRLVPDAEPWRLWGRFQRARTGWPTRAPLVPTAQLEAGGVLIVVSRTDPARTRLGGLAPAIEHATGVVARVGDEASIERASGGPSPVVVDLTERTGRAAKLAALLGLVERAARARGPNR